MMRQIVLHVVKEVVPQHQAGILDSSPMTLTKYSFILSDQSCLLKLLSSDCAPVLKSVV